jgi:hypothetical protein
MIQNSDANWMYHWAMGLFWSWAEPFPSALFHIFFSSFFSIFLFLLYIFQTCSKLLQTNFVEFQKFKATF